MYEKYEDYPDSYKTELKGKILDFIFDDRTLQNTVMPKRHEKES
jgi:hypothetical protein